MPIRRRCLLPRLRSSLPRSLATLNVESISLKQRFTWLWRLRAMLPRLALTLRLLRFAKVRCELYPIICATAIVPAPKITVPISTLTTIREAGLTNSIFPMVWRRAVSTIPAIVAGKRIVLMLPHAIDLSKRAFWRVAGFVMAVEVEINR